MLARFPCECEAFPGWLSAHGEKFGELLGRTDLFEPTLRACTADGASNLIDTCDIYLQGTRHGNNWRYCTMTRDLEGIEWVGIGILVVLRGNSRHSPSENCWASCLVIPSFSRVLKKKVCILVVNR